MITAIAIDDEPLALEILIEYCTRLSSIDLVKTYTNQKEANKYLRKFPVDLIFLDIQMPDQLGTDLYRSLGQSTQVIFTTAHEKYAIEAFELNALDYLLKPISFNRFSDACEKAVKWKNQSVESNDLLWVRSDYSLKKIKFSDIEFIEGMDDYIIIHQIDKKEILTKMTMKKILSQLPVKEFIRVHRSFIIPVSKVESVRNKTIYINSKAISIGCSYEKKVMEYLNSL